jgi:hypothetical protein
MAENYKGSGRFSNVIWDYVQTSESSGLGILGEMEHFMYKLRPGVHKNVYLRIFVLQHRRKFNKV